MALLYVLLDIFRFGILKLTRSKAGALYLLAVYDLVHQISGNMFDIVLNHILGEFTSNCDVSYVMALKHIHDIFCMLVEPYFVRLLSRGSSLLGQTHIHWIAGLYPVKRIYYSISMT